jgi:hypothetical protein
MQRQHLLKLAQSVFLQGQASFPSGGQGEVLTEKSLHPNGFGDKTSIPPPYFPFSLVHCHSISWLPHFGHMSK